MLTCRYFFKDKDHFGIHTQALKSGANLQDHDATFNFYYIFDNPIPSWMCHRYFPVVCFLCSITTLKKCYGCLRDAFIQL